MSSNLLKLNTRQLRALFLQETKKFMKVLDYSSDTMNEELKDQMLNEIRENLKEIMHLIELREREEMVRTN